MTPYEPRDANAIHPKVKVPALVLTILTLVLVVLAAIPNAVPAWAPIASALATILQVVSGYLTVE